MVLKLQAKSTLAHLSTLVSMLIDGPEVTSKKFSQQILPIPQLIQTNFRENRDNELIVNRRSMKEREIPAIIYSRLWKNTIKHNNQSFFQFEVMFIAWPCVRNYERIFRLLNKTLYEN